MLNKPEKMSTYLILIISPARVYKHDKQNFIFLLHTLKIYFWPEFLDFRLLDTVARSESIQIASSTIIHSSSHVARNKCTYSNHDSRAEPWRTDQRSNASRLSHAYYESLFFDYSLVPVLTSPMMNALDDCNGRR